MFQKMREASKPRPRHRGIFDFKILDLGRLETAENKYLGRCLAGNSETAYLREAICRKLYAIAMMMVVVRLSAKKDDKAKGKVV